MLGNRGNRSTACWSTPRSSSRRSTSAARKWTSQLQNVSAVSQQFAGFINDNPNLNNVLSQLQVVSDVLAKHKDDLAYSITTASKFMGALTEASAVPGFKTLIVNLLPYQIIQPWVDAAFKKRGIDPEEFWRNAGLPAYRFPRTRTARPSPTARRRPPRRSSRAPRSPGSRGSPARRAPATPGLGGVGTPSNRCRVPRPPRVPMARCPVASARRMWVMAPPNPAAAVPNHGCQLPRSPAKPVRCCRAPCPTVRARSAWSPYGTRSARPASGPGRGRRADR